MARTLAEELDRLEEIDQLTTLSLFAGLIREDIAKAEPSLDSEVLHDIQGSLDYMDDELKQMIRGKQV